MGRVVFRCAGGPAGYSATRSRPRGTWGWRDTLRIDAGPSLEELYDRYRRRGDVRALAELFDRASPELFALALRLSEDAAAGEDALQDTWLVALEAEGEVRAVMPWLVGILKNKVRRIRRTARRSPFFDSAAAEFLDDEPAAAAQREEALREVRAALDDLPETYREVAVLRWRYGLDPSEIADARGMPPGTVRSLLSRAAEKLRASLGALTIVAGIRPARGLPEIRKAVLAKAGAGAATTAASLMGALVMSKKIGIAAVVVLALSAGWLTFRDDLSPRPPDPAGPPVPNAGRAEVHVPHDEGASADPVASPADAVEDETPDADAEAGTARITVRWADGTPAAGVFVRVYAWDGPDPLNRFQELSTGADGRMVIPGLAPGRIIAYSDRGVTESTKLEAGGTVAFTMDLSPGIDVAGVVVGTDGAPVEGAGIWLSDYGNHTQGRVVTRSGPGGSFRIRSVTKWHYVGARAPGHAPSGLSYIQGSDGDRADLRLVLEGGGGEVAGRVRLPDGSPVEDARVRVGPTDFRNVLLENGTAVPASPPLEVRTDAGGAFRVEGVPPGRNLVQVRALGLTPGREEIELEPGERAEVEITLQTGGIVTGVVADTAGRTVPGASIRLGEYAGFLSSSAIAGPDGSFRLEGLPVGPISIRAGKKDVGKAAANLRVLSGRVLTWNPVLKSSAGVTGTVVDEDGAPRVGWLVQVYERTRPTTWRGRRKTGEDGGFDIPDCPTSPLRLDVYPPNERGYSPFPCASVLDPVVGGDPLRIQITAEALPSAYVRGVLVDPDGRFVGDAVVSIRHLDTGFAPAHRTEKETGRFSIGPLPRGMYAIEVKADGWPPLKFGERSLSSREELDLGRLELRAGGEVVARVARADGEPLKNAWSELIDARGTGTVYPAIRDGLLRSGPLSPGAYVLRAQAITGKGSVLAQIPIEIRAGEKVELDLVLEPGPRMAVQVYFPEGAPTSATIRVRARDEDGNLVLDSRLYAASSLSLLPGRYTVEAATTSGLRAEASVEVAPPGGGSDPDPIVLRLR